MVDKDGLQMSPLDFILIYVINICSGGGLMGHPDLDMAV